MWFGTLKIERVDSILYVIYLVSYQSTKRVSASKHITAKQKRNLIHLRSIAK